MVIIRHCRAFLFKITVHAGLTVLLCSDTVAVQLLQAVEVQHRQPISLQDPKKRATLLKRRTRVVYARRILASFVKGRHFKKVYCFYKTCR
jgi:hypothetical protein